MGTGGIAAIRVTDAQGRPGDRCARLVGRHEPARELEG
jgi:hypothetical protein